MSHFDPNAAATPDSGIFGLSHNASEARVILLQAPFDATTSYRRGAAHGPEAILRASRQVDLHDFETGDPYLSGIHLCHAPPLMAEWNEQARAAADPVIAAAGDLSESPELQHQLSLVNEAGERVTRTIEGLAGEYLSGAHRGAYPHRIVGLIGGDHSVSLGTIAAHARRFPGMGILHLDAHADLRRAYEGFVHSHASIMDNVMERVAGVARLVQVGIRDACDEEVERARSSHGRIVMHTEAALRHALFGGEPWTQICDRIVAGLPQQVYVSFDIDGLDPALCPHTGTPVPGGLSFAEATALLHAVVRSGRLLCGFDLTEVAPGPDPDDEWDGNVGARVLYKLIGFTLLTRP
jgi:agmatinase